MVSKVVAKRHSCPLQVAPAALYPSPHTLPDPPVIVAVMPHIYRPDSRSCARTSPPGRPALLAPLGV